MAKKMTRRDFLMAALSTVGGLTLLEVIQLVTKAQAWRHQKTLPLVSRGLDPSRTPTPTSTSTPTPTPTITPTATATRTASPPPGPADPRVIHIRAANVTHWNGQDNGYYQYVYQDVVNNMFDQALLSLTGQSTAAAAWNFLFTRVNANGYQADEKIAIKINMNYGDFDNNNCITHNNRIEETPQAVVSLLRSLKNNVDGLNYSNIYLYDATKSYAADPNGRSIYEYFRSTINTACPGVHYIGRSSCANVIAPTYGHDSSLTVHFGALSSSGLQDRKLTDILYDADYLINMPLLKGHGTVTDSGSSTLSFSGAFKNHYGSIDYVMGTVTSNNLHEYTNLYSNLYNSNHCPFVYIYQNPNIANKTILTVVNGLFGSIMGDYAYPNWDYFNNQNPNSLLLSADPVALDTVLGDILSVQRNFNVLNRNMGWLKLAETAGLGKTEANPNAWRDPRQTNAYSVIEYTIINM